MAKTKLPKDVGGVKLPADVRRAGDALIRRAHSRLGREALTAGMTLAAVAVVAATGGGKITFEIDDDSDGDAPEPPPSPPTQPEPPTPPVTPEPPVRPTAPKPTGTTIPISPAQAQAVADALGNVAEAAITRFLGGRRFG